MSFQGKKSIPRITVSPSARASAAAWRGPASWPPGRAHLPAGQAPGPRPGPRAGPTPCPGRAEDSKRRAPRPRPRRSRVSAPGAEGPLSSVPAEARPGEAADSASELDGRGLCWRRQRARGAEMRGDAAWSLGQPPAPPPA